MKALRCAISLLALLQLPRTAISQSFAEIGSVGSGCIAGANAESYLSRYVDLYFDGKYDDLADAIQGDLERIEYDPKPKEEPKLSAFYVSVVFVATPPTETDPTVIRFLIPPKGSPVTVPPQRIPGLPKLYEVYLAQDKASLLSSSWSSTETANPLRAQLRKFAGAAVGAVAGGLDRSRDTKEFRPAAEGGRCGANPLFAAVRVVRLPHKRASLQIATRVTNPAVGDVVSLKKEFKGLLAGTHRGPARISPCALVLAEALDERAQGALDKKLVDTPSGTVDDAFRQSLVKSLEEELDRALALGMCVSEARDTGSPAALHPRATAVADVGTRFLDLARGDGQPLSATSEMQNAPLQYFSLGLVAGAMLQRYGDVHFEVSNGLLAPKPVSGVVTAAALHVHPVAYDPTAPQATAGERFSLLAGFVTTPAPGLTAGISGRFFRGLGIQASYAWMLVDQLKAKFEPGQAVTVTDDPFRRGITRAWVLGISYDFD